MAQMPRRRNRIFKVRIIHKKWFAVFGIVSADHPTVASFNFHKVFQIFANKIELLLSVDSTIHDSRTFFADLINFHVQLTVLELFLAKDVDCELVKVLGLIREQTVHELLILRQRFDEVSRDFESPVVSQEEVNQLDDSSRVVDSPRLELEPKHLELNRKRISLHVLVNSLSVTFVIVVRSFGGEAVSRNVAGVVEAKDPHGLVQLHGHAAEDLAHVALREPPQVLDLPQPVGGCDVADCECADLAVVRVDMRHPVVLVDHPRGAAAGG
mmetsp:Transcript_15028/g.17358  ORF Transcript_15028/g.17358 Transcript_15028/m.17358 type:complete len:269 (+) Transcript_15028:142-948(+)